MEHMLPPTTPTPWRTSRMGGQTIYGPGGSKEKIAVMCSGPYAHANALHIVSAVNTYDEMLRAVGRLQKSEEQMRSPSETMEGYLLRTIRAEYLEQAAREAEGNAPNNEPGEYWKGRRDAAGLIRALIEKSQ
jgi:cell division protein ZapA (FtsZ GTPase activity inhibitor)